MYVSKPARERLDKGATPASPAELAYCVIHQCLDLGDTHPHDWLYAAIETEIHAYLLNRHVTFTDLAAVLGSLDYVRREYKRRVPDNYLLVESVIRDVAGAFYRDVVTPHTQHTINTNGDIFS